jgi:hypothetical protein
MYVVEEEKRIKLVAGWWARINPKMAKAKEQETVPICCFHLFLFR